MPLGSRTLNSGDLVDDLTREAHSFEDTEESLVVQAVKGFFPVEEGNNAGDLAFLGDFGKSSECEEGLGCTALRSEAVLLIVKEVFDSVLNSDPEHDAVDL